VRRVVSIPLVVLALLVGLPLAPPVLLIATVVDFAKHRPLLPTVRAASFVYQMLVLELCAIVTAFVLWVAFGFGLAVRSKPSRCVHTRVQAWWVGQVVAAARRSAHLVFEGPNPAVLAPGPVVVLARHASYADALLPALLFGHRQKMALRYVLAKELTWDPALGLYGNRLPNVFVDRSNRAESQLDAIRRLGVGLETDGAAVLFPEGQFRTPARFERAVERLAESDPALAERARCLHHLMPPRPAGALALLDGAAGADVIVLGHIGLDRFGTIGDVFRNVPICGPIRVTAWRIAAADVPDGDADRLEWLWGEWERLDAWISQTTKDNS
jgi:1-acyl-sn-glycerol-3-phosphate acyltransferase